jgi:hypothetical protein
MFDRVGLSSSLLASSLLALDLIDEPRIRINSVILGAGRVYSRKEIRGAN